MNRPSKESAKKAKKLTEEMLECPIDDLGHLSGYGGTCFWFHIGNALDAEAIASWNAAIEKAAELMLGQYENRSCISPHDARQAILALRSGR